MMPPSATPCARQCTSIRPFTRRAPRFARCSASDDSKPSSDSPLINEDILAKLRKFEEENTKLKAQLAEQEAGSSQPAATAKKAGRIDGKGMKRETIFTDTESKSGNWLSEADVDFFTGGGAFETDKKDEITADAQATVNKRVLIGAGLSVLTVALALIPTEALDGESNKPLSFYLVPVIRSISLLDDLATEISNDQFDSIPLAVDRVLNKPNESRKNMYSAIEFISNSQTKQAARETVSNFIDYVQQADYNTYYDSVSKKAVDGKQSAQFADFSLKSVRSAARLGREFLSYFPKSDVREATELAAPTAL